MSKNSPQSAGQSPTSVSSSHHSTFNGSNDSVNDAELQLLRSKIDVLNATILNEKCRFAQEYGDMQKHYRLRISDLEKRVNLTEQNKSVHPIEKENAEAERRLLHTTIVNLQNELAKQNARPSLENKVAELEKRAAMSEEKACRTEDLEMECRRLQSLVSKLQKKLADEQRLKQEVPIEKTSYSAVQLAECRNKMEEMALSFKASNKQAQKTIYTLRQQLSDNVKEQTEMVAALRREMEESHRKELDSANEGATNARRDAEECKKKIEQLKAQIAESNNNRLETTGSNQPSSNPDYSSVCRQSLENMVGFYRQKLTFIEKENLALKIDNSKNQAYIHMLNSSLAAKIEEQKREKREFEAKVAAVNISARIWVKENGVCPISVKTVTVSEPIPETKRKSSSLCDEQQPAAKQAKPSPPTETAPDTTSVLKKIKEEVDCQIFKVKTKPKKAVAALKTVKEERNSGEDAARPCLQNTWIAPFI
uniref:Uncharacterized protein n=1 Tax=Ditylenchus dipsaci TaxID=166011 RepID=A0A915EF84_9BILA